MGFGFGIRMTGRKAFAKPTRTASQSKTNSRSNGYRELGMYDESILELEDIEGEDRWHRLKLKRLVCDNR